MTKLNSCGSGWVADKYIARLSCGDAVESVPGSEKARLKNLL